MGKGETPPGHPTFEQVVEREGARLWRLTAGYEWEQDLREDLYQEILVAIWGALPRFRGEASLTTFVLRVAHNRAVSHRARQRLRQQREHPIDATLPDHRAAPDQRAEQNAEREALLRAVRALPPSLGQTVMLHLEGLSHGEIGDVLGITANAAAIRLSRAREALRDTMRKEAAR